MNKYLFKDIVIGNDGLLKGPFGSDLKKSLYVPKANNTYKVYLQENILFENNSAGNYYITKEYYDTKMKKYAVQEKDFIVTCDGTLGEIYQLKNLKEKGIISSSLLRITVNPDIVDYDYFYYYFKYYIKKALIVKGNNSVLKHLPGIEVIKNLSIELPNLYLQKKIGKILKNIDNKIDDNNKIINESEKLAKQIYDYWFKQFEFPDKNGNPYKSSNGEMIYNEKLKKEIPENWEVGNLYDIADFINGLACQKYRPKKNELSLPVIKIREMNEGISSDTERVSSGINEKYIVNDNSILFSWSATLEVIRWYGGKAGLNQHIFKINPTKYGINYTYQQLKSYINNFVKIALSRKTTMGHITTDHIKQSVIVLPPKSIVNRYEKMVSSLYNKLLLKSKENEELSKLKNFLLPLLMNGQVGFKD